MTDPEKIHFKTSLKQFALAIIGLRIAAAKEAIEQAQQAANQEEKSSAGDKYETGRAMGQIDTEMNARQLEEARRELEIIHSIPLEALHTKIGPGSVVVTDGLVFFISLGLGNKNMHGNKIALLSPKAPIAGFLKGKEKLTNYSNNIQCLVQY